MPQIQFICPEIMENANNTTYRCSGRTRNAGKMNEHRKKYHQRPPGDQGLCAICRHRYIIVPNAESPEENEEPERHADNNHKQETIVPFIIINRTGR